MKGQNGRNELERAVELFLLFGRTYDLLVREVECRLRKIGVSQAKYSALRHLSRDETVSLTELGARMARGHSNLTTLCRRMEQAGLVEVAASQDRREKRVRLTEQGRLLREKVIPVHRRHLLEIFGSLDGEEERLFREFLLRVQERCSGSGRR